MDRNTSNSGVEDLMDQTSATLLTMIFVKQIFFVIFP